MSKDLETEYKDLMDAEVSKIDADALWNRIESALPEKTAAPAETVAPEETVTPEIIKPLKWYKNKKVISFMGTAAAACIILWLALPGLRNFNISQNTMPAYTENASSTTVSKSMEATSEAVAEATAEKSESAETDAADICENAASPTVSETPFVNDMEKSEILAELAERGEAGNVTKEETSASSISESKFETFSLVTEFEVIEGDDGIYICAALSSNTFFDTGDEFILATLDEQLTVGESYSFDLEPLTIINGKSAYSIK